jgi:hypothetical protein
MNVNNDTNILGRIQVSLPSLPVEIAREWLLPYALSLSWPPTLDHAGVPIGRWQLLLMSRPLAYWRDLGWKRQYLPVDLESLSSRSRETIAGMHDAYLKGVANSYSTIDHGVDRFFGIMISLSQKGELPHSPVLVADPDGFTVVDGNHRVAAYITYRNMWRAEQIRSQFGADDIPPPKSVSCWVGT